MTLATAIASIHTTLRDAAGVNLKEYPELIKDVDTLRNASSRVQFHRSYHLSIDEAGAPRLPGRIVPQHFTCVLELRYHFERASQQNTIEAEVLAHNDLHAITRALIGAKLSGVHRLENQGRPFVQLEDGRRVVFLMRLELDYFEPIPTT